MLLFIELFKTIGNLSDWEDLTKLCVIEHLLAWNHRKKWADNGW